MWWGIHTDPVLKSFNNLKGMNYRDMPVGVVLDLSGWLMV
jgi:hypothetical protein